MLRRRPRALFHNQMAGRAQRLDVKEDSDGKERTANGEEAGHQVPQPAKEVAEGQGPGSTGQEEVTMASDRDFLFGGASIVSGSR